nr:reverse transcriptase domain-containing protein [Tanacetum cinerariifolium]
MHSPSGSGSLPSNTIANPRVDLKAITIRSGVSYDGPIIPPTFTPLPKEVEREPEATKHKNLLSNKEKLFELVDTSVNENCSAVLLKKLPENLGDPGKFLIPCDFPKLEECLALAALSTSINLKPLFVWKKLSLLKLTLTRMTLELANQLVVYPIGIAEDVFVKVGKFHFLADFVVVDYDVDPQLELKDLPSHLEYAFLEDNDKLPIIIAKNLKDDEKACLLKDNFKLAVQHQRRVNPKIQEVIKKEVIKLLDAGLIYPIYDSLWIFSGKFKTRWTRPFTVTQVFPYGTVELSQTNRQNFKVNSHRLKHYFGGDIPPMVVPDIQTFLMDH